ncbi:MAG: gamma-glutamyl-gamma-aminobutyrate hydrolase family protein [Psychromonas sp.]|nr:gamma-glutamyl-gamma-aminobutyrate hydrolase family protein [Psychromonas sp.]
MHEKHTFKALIFISQRVDYLKERNETRDSIDQALTQWVIAADAIPLCLPNVLSEDMLNQLLTQLKPDGIILSGGNNIGQYLQRDSTEHFLFNWALLNKIPVLGICRGMQLIGKLSGVSLISVSGHTAVKHKIEGILNADVKSYHDKVLENVPSGFNALAYALDGHLEAIKSTSDWPCEAWMWHPERETPFNSIWLARFRSLIKENK